MKKELDDVASTERLDWTLFSVLAIGSQGFSVFLPGNPVNTSLALCSVIIGFWIVPKMADGLRLLLLNPMVAFLVAWSVGAALLSSRQLVSLILNGTLILMIMYAGLRQKSTKITVLTFAAATTASLVPSAVGYFSPLPTLRGAGTAAGYAGFFPWNSTAGICAAAAILGLALTYVVIGFKWWQLPSIAMAAMMLAVSKSATAILTLILALAVMATQQIVRRVDRQRRPLVLIAAAVVGFFLVPRIVDFFSATSNLAKVANRTESLSGRTQIWEWALDGISRSPYWGYGAGFWTSAVGWNNSAHNGFIDVALNAGLPAFIAVCVIIVVSAAKHLFAQSILLPLLIYGVASNMAFSLLATPNIASMAIWLAVGANLRHTASRPSANGRTAYTGVVSSMPNRRIRNPM